MANDWYWSAEDDATLVRMWEAGETGSAIALAVNRSRNAVMGRLNRLSLMRNPGASYRRLVTAYGQTRCITEWARSRKISRGTIERRLGLGWSPEAAIFTPTRKYKPASGRPPLQAESKVESETQTKVEEFAD